MDLTLGERTGIVGPFLAWLLDRPKVEIAPTLLDDGEPERTIAVARLRP